MFPTVFSKHCIQRTHHRLNTGEVKTNWLTHNVRRTNEEKKDQRERERESSVTEKSQKINTLLFKIIMKKYKQFYKYSYCVKPFTLSSAHQVNFFFFFLITHVATMYPVLCFIKWKIFFFWFFFFCTRKQKCFPIWQLTVDEVSLTHTHLLKHARSHTLHNIREVTTIEMKCINSTRPQSWRSMKSELKLHWNYNDFFVTVEL